MSGQSTNEYKGAFLGLPLHAGEGFVEFGGNGANTVGVGLVQDGISSVRCFN